MNQWSRNRKRLILAMVLFVLVVLIGVPAFFLFYQGPTCFDGEKNGDEAGVDCGGSCQLLCRAESLPLILKGDPRVLALASSTYQVVALVENPNTDAEIYKAGYTLKLYDEGVLPIKEISGATYVPEGQTFALFEGPFTIETGAVPRRATLEWDKETLVWQKNPTAPPALRIKESVLSREETSPRLDVVVENPTLARATNVDLVALLSDAGGNIFAASKTFIDLIGPGQEARAVFTWPKPFGRPVVGINIIIRIFPDRSLLR